MRLKHWTAAPTATHLCRPRARAGRKEGVARAEARAISPRHRHCDLVREPSLTLLRLRAPAMACTSATLERGSACGLLHASVLVVFVAFVLFFVYGVDRVQRGGGRGLQRESRRAADAETLPLSPPLPPPHWLGPPRHHGGQQHTPHTYRLRRAVAQQHGVLGGTRPGRRDKSGERGERPEGDAEIRRESEEAVRGLRRHEQDDHDNNRRRRNRRGKAVRQKRARGSGA